MNDTPRTNAAWGERRTNILEFTRKLEREADDYRKRYEALIKRHAALKKLIRELEERSVGI